MQDESLELLRKQNKLLTFIAGILAILIVIAIFCTAVLLPKASSALESANTALTQINTAAADLDVVAAQLIEADLPGLVNDTEKLLAESSGGVQSAVEKLNNVDIEGLNTAIGQLQSVVAPLARLFGGR